VQTVGSPVEIHRRLRLTAPHLRRAYERHFHDHRRERAFLSALSFTTAFAGCRIVTHSIRAGVGPFKNMSVGGRHLHHSTPGIIALILLGDVWVYRYALGDDDCSRTGSRASVVAYGIATALTLDEFALWFDLQDDYWTAAGRKSVDAVTIFGGLSVVGAAGRGLPGELRHALAAARREF
jgi:hypothetical protein